MPLSERELKTLAAVCDSLVPSIGPEESQISAASPQEETSFYSRRASDLGVDKALAEIIELRLEPSLRKQFRRLLSVMDSSLYNLLLSGKPVSFSKLDLKGREEYLQTWRDSKLGLKRQGFQALKRLALFLFYTLIEDSGENPNWSSIGYPGPQFRTHGLHHPEQLKIVPLPIQRDQELSCDVCIVGSGAGGSVVAFELSRRGYQVVVLEAGPYATADNFEQGELSMMNKLFEEYGTAATKDQALILLSGRTAGGGTAVNWMTCIRPPEEVLRTWQEEFGIPGLLSKEFQGYTDEIWDTLKVNQQESQLNPNNELLWRGCQALGYNEGSDYERIWRNAVDCHQRCAFCTYGCVYSCKQSTLLNFLPFAFQHGARFLFDAKVKQVTVAGGAVKGLEAVCVQGGREFQIRVRAKCVVLACGAVKTPALLLNSGIRQKNIGKYLRLHPTTAVAGRFREEVRAWEGPPQTVVVKKFWNQDASGHGFWIEAAPAHPGLFAMGAPWAGGRSHKEIMRQRYAHSTASIVLLKEWGGGNVTVDKHGSPLVGYNLEQKDKGNLKQGLKETGKILAAAGATGLSTLHSELLETNSRDEKDPLSQSDLDHFYDLIEKRKLEPNTIVLFSAHLMGGCRMGADEKLAAVDVSGEVYGIANLFVADASVFPTTLGVNPMITIMSMARRTSEFIARRLESPKVPA